MNNLGGYLSKLYLSDPNNWRNNVECEAGDSISKVSPYDVFSHIPDKNWYTDKNYIQVHLKRAILIGSYKIHSERNGPGYAHPKNWAFRGSNNGQNWTVLHSKTNCPDLNGRAIIKQYKTNSKKPFSYYQLYRTGPSWSEYNTQYRIALLSIDIFPLLNFPSSFQEPRILINLNFINLLFS